MSSRFLPRPSAQLKNSDDQKHRFDLSSKGKIGQNRAKHHCHPQKNLLQTNFRPSNTQDHQKQKASKNSHDLYDEKHRIARRRERSTEVEEACAELGMIERTWEGGGGSEGKGKGEEEKRANPIACCC